MNIAIIGSGKYCKMIEEMISENEEYTIAGFLDDRYIYIDFRGNQFFGPITTANKIIKFYKDLKFVIATENNAIRKSIVQKLGLIDNDFATLCSKNAVISPSAQIGQGTVIFAGAIINSNSKVGKHCFVDSGAVIDNGNSLDDFVHISLNATLTSTVKIGEGVYVKAGATIISSMIIDKWSVIEAGVQLIDEIPSQSTGGGIPVNAKLNKVIGGI